MSAPHSDSHDPSSPELRFVQHHYDDARHQFDSSKLGMWFFLAQEILFFSALFVAYIVYRAHYPQIFMYANHYLDVNMGAVNTAILLISSLTAAWAVRAAQLRQQKLLVGLLLATVVCALGFLGIKYVEYSHKFHEGLLWGTRFDPCISASGKPLLTKSNRCPGTKSSVIYDPAQKAAATGCIAGDLDQDAKQAGLQAQCDVTERIVTFRRNGDAYEKVEQGKRSIASCADSKTKPCWELVRNDQVCGLTAEKKPQHAALVHYGDHLVRGAKVQIDAACRPAPAVAAPADPFAEAPSVATSTAADGSQSLQAMRGTVITGATDASASTAVGRELADSKKAFLDGTPPPNTNMFFSIYFAMTGLHGIHVIVGVFIFLWLLFRAMLGHFGPQYFGPIDSAALYWHLVDLIWIFLFPLMYLIH